MALSRQKIATVLRQAGMADAADDALVTLPDHATDEDLEQFCVAHGLSAESLMERMGASP